MSFQNLMMLSASVPKYKSRTKEGNGAQPKDFNQLIKKQMKK